MQFTCKLLGLEHNAAGERQRKNCYFRLAPGGSFFPSDPRRQCFLRTIPEATLKIRCLSQWISNHGIDVLLVFVDNL